MYSYMYNSYSSNITICIVVIYYNKHSIFRCVRNQANTQHLYLSFRPSVSLSVCLFVCSHITTKTTRPDRLKL